MLKLRNKQSEKEGFTIIEVVLVLAIAGLIMMMVFVALPALQRSQRNTQRKNDMGRLSAALTEYQGNNHNKVPSDMNDLITDYLGGEDGFSGPNNPYAIKKAGECTDTCPSGSGLNMRSGDEIIAYYINAKCLVTDSTDVDPVKMVEPASTKTKLVRKIAFVIKMEGSTDENGPLYCINN